MYPLSDKDLDRISREAAEQTDMDQSPSGWEKLEHRLNKELPQEKEKDRRRFLWIFLLLLLLSGSGSAWFFMAHQKSSGIPGSQAQQPVSANHTKGTTPAPSDDQPSGKKTAGNSDTDLQTDSPSSVARSEEPVQKDNGEKHIGQASDVTSPTNPDAKKSGPKNRVASNSVPPATRKRQLLRDNRKGTIPAKDMASSRNRKQQSSIDSRYDQIATETTSPVKKEAPPVNNPPATSQEAAISSDKPTEKAMDSVVAHPTPTVIDSAKSVATTRQTTSGKSRTAGSFKNSRWAFSAVAGLDYTNIHGRGTSKLGYNLGLLASFNVTKRLSVSSGILLTKKFYKADSSSFHPPKHYFTYYVDQLNWVDGHCYMWDIPLNIRYDVIVRPTSRWFINAGMTSYIMRKQQYTYEYVYNSAPSTKQWQTNSQQNEWFKIANLSIGWEKQFSSNWSLQAEPFMKLPLTGVGFGKMDMSTSGVLLSVRYRPKFKTK